MTSRTTRAEFVKLAGAGAFGLALSTALPRIGFSWAQEASLSGDEGSPNTNGPQASPLSLALGTEDFRASLPDQRVYIMVATDMHFISPRLTDHGPFFQELIHSSDAKLMDYSEEVMDTLVATALAERPDVLVIPGDLTYNGARESHEDIVVKLRKISDAGIPIVVIPGNHDIDSPYAARFEGDGYEIVDSVDANEFAELYADFGYGSVSVDAAGGGGARTLSRDDASLSYVWELAPGLRLLMLDVNGVTTFGTAVQGAAAPATIEWVDAQLADAASAGARVVAFSHQSLIQQTFIDYGYVVSNAADILPLYKRAGVIANLCGHLHLQHYAVDEDGFCDVATSALSVSPCQFARVVIVPEDDESSQAASSNAWLEGPLRLDYRTVPMDAAVSAWAAQSGRSEEDLVDFSSYAKRFFMGDESSREAAAAQLLEQGYTDARELVDFSAEVNYAYFTGRLDLLEPRPDLVDQWSQINALTGYYMRYIFDIAPVHDENAVSVSVDG